MAVTHRFPVLVWQDHQGTCTARLVDRDEPAGIGRSAGAALHQLEDYLNWYYQQNPGADGPDFLEPQLAQFKVSVRPEYEVDKRRYPCEEPVLLRVYGVHGRQQQGLLVCALPMLDLRFYYFDPAALKGLVTHYVQQRLEGLTPRDLARYLPPAQASLQTIPITVRQREGSGQAQEAGPVALQAVAEPLGGPAVRRQYHRPWLRDGAVQNLVRRVGAQKANVVLLGGPGSGKTTVLVEAVRQLEREAQGQEQQGPQARPQRRYWQTSAGRLIAGMKYLGQWEQRCEQIIAELGQISGALCVDNLLDLVREGGDAPASSLASFFLPYLQRGELRMVAEATPAELDACRRLLPGFADVFQVLALPPFTRSEAIDVLDNLTKALAQNHHVEVGRGVVDQVDQLFRRFMPYAGFPGPVVRFVTQVFECARQEKRGEVDTEQVLRHFIRQTGLPELFLRDLPLAREDVLATFRRQIIGQEEACQTVADLVTTFKAGLNDPGRPLGVLLFCGPTGVGKTEMARALARYFFGHGEQAERLVRLDMSEYTGFGAGERLLTRPDGQPSLLIEKLRQQPFTLVLLDEIEKADAEVFDVLLGVFDEGRLTDRFGRVTTFKSAVLVMTSNLGADRQETFGFGQPVGVPYESEAMQFFRPELFNRIDAVVTFGFLSEEMVRDITRKELGEIGQREGVTRLGVRLEWTERLVAHLAREGFDARYGARPLQRTLEALVVVPLARYLLDGPAVGGTVRLDVEEGKVVIGTE